MFSCVKYGGVGDCFCSIGCKSVGGGEVCFRGGSRIVVGTFYLLLVWLVVLYYHLPLPAVCSDSFDCGEKYGSVVAG